MGRDEVFQKIKIGADDFNPFSPYGERRLQNAQDELKVLFQSPLPMRGETCEGGDCEKWLNFNPLSPCVERRLANRLRAADAGISIPSPHTGRDPTPCSICKRMIRFQSPLPIRGETRSSRSRRRRPPISIPSPHTGRDPTVPPLC